MDIKKIEDNAFFPAYYSMGLVGYDVGTDGENAYYRYVGMSGPEPYTHRSKIRYTGKGKPYFLINGRRIHLDECLRKDLGGGRCA